MLTPPSVNKFEDLSGATSTNTKVNSDDSESEHTITEDVDMEQKETGSTRGNLRSTWFQYRDMCEDKIAEIEKELDKMELTVKHKTKLRN